MTELKPCPFCGGNAKIHTDYSEKNAAYYVYLQCAKCYARSKTIKSNMQIEENNEAVAAWNMRTYEETNGL